MNALEFRRSIAAGNSCVELQEYATGMAVPLLGMLMWQAVYGAVYTYEHYIKYP
jgi:hypothetical protein